MAALIRHHGRSTDEFTLYLLQDDKLLFDSSNRRGTVTQRCILHSVKPPPDSIKELWDWRSTSPSRDVI